MKIEDIEERLELFLKRERELRSRALINIVFKAGVLRVGGGGSEARLPLVYVETSEGMLPVIPESSWRGVLRRISELIAKSSAVNVQDPIERALIESHHEPEAAPLSHFIEEKVNEETRVIPFDPRELTKEEDLSEGEKERRRRLRRRFLPEDLEGAGLEVYEPVAAALCPICRLWGGMGLRGKLVLSDTLIRGDIHMRTHVSIDRPSGVRYEGALYNVEYVVPKELSLEIVVNNVDPGTTEALILAGTLEWVKELGIEVGGFKSRGPGLLTVKEGKVYLADYAALEGEALLEALVNPRKGRAMELDEYIEYLRRVKEP